MGRIDPLNFKKTERKQTSKQNEKFKRQRKNLVQTKNYIKCTYTMYVQSWKTISHRTIFFFCCVSKYLAAPEARKQMDIILEFIVNRTT